jgi:hypothetical protein
LAEEVSDGTSETAEFPPPPPTVPVPTEPRAYGGSYLAMLFVAVAAGSFLVGIAAATATREPVDEARTVASRNIGPSGGTLRFEGGELRFPDGAVSEPVRVVVRRATVDDRVRVEVAADDPLVFEPGALDSYSFEPAGTTFLKPVELTFRLPPGARNGTIFARRGGAIVLLAGTVDGDRGTATARVRDFGFEGGS